MREQKLQMDNIHTFDSAVIDGDFGSITHIRLNIFPDGGISRVRVFGPLSQTIDFGSASTVSGTTVAEAEVPFGDVIETEGAQRIEINEGTTEVHDLATVDVEFDGGHPLINIFRGQPRPQPIGIHMVERHPLGSQALSLMQAYKWLLVVVPPGDAPDLSQLRAFGPRAISGITTRMAPPIAGAETRPRSYSGRPWRSGR